jgi:hypothetical protein
MSSYGQIAYEAYCKSTGGVSLVSGNKLPSWDEQLPGIKRGWEAAADEVRECYDQEMEGRLMRQN